MAHHNKVIGTVDIPTIKSYLLALCTLGKKEKKTQLLLYSTYLLTRSVGAGEVTFDHVFKSLIFCCSSSCSLWAPSLNNKSHNLQTCEGGREGGREAIKRKGGGGEASIVFHLCLSFL